MKFALLALIAFLPVFAQEKAQDKGAQALNGNDPVILATQDDEKLGSPKITVSRGGFLYQFVNEKNKATFEKNPAQYEIQMGGACARMGAGSGASGNPGLYGVYKNRIYIFGTDDCKTTFMKDPQTFVSK